jgi:hypothetical protein
VKASKFRWSSAEQVACIVRDCLAEGKRVEIDGLGVFRRRRHGYDFAGSVEPRVFIAYVEENSAQANRLYDLLECRGFHPWMDRRKLLPGQNWPRAIERAIETSDYFLACFSHQSVAKKGGFQAEIRYALDCAKRIPLDEIFLIPLRLDDCKVPARIGRELQYIDLFPSWSRGVRRLLAVLAKGRPVRPPATPRTRGRSCAPEYLLG